MGEVMASWIWTFLCAFSVAAAVMGLLCWLLWRYREDKPSRAEQEAYHEAKARAEMGVTAEDDNPRTYAEIAARCTTPAAVSHALSVRPGPAHIDLPADLKSSHTTAADGNVFTDLGFPAQEAKALLADADARCLAASVAQSKTAGLQALPKVLLPMSDSEMEALSAFEWLEREANLPDSIKTFFWNKLERAADVVLPEVERESLRGCTDVSLYRAAFDVHFARRRANETT